VKGIESTMINFFAFITRENEDDYVQFTAQTRVPMLGLLMTISHNLTSIPIFLNLSTCSNACTWLQAIRCITIFMFILHIIPTVGWNLVASDFGCQHNHLGILKLIDGNWILSEDVIGNLQKSNLKELLKIHYVTFQLCTVLGYAIIHSLYFIAQIQGGQCPFDNITAIAYCNPHADTYGLPLDGVVILLLTPICCMIAATKYRTYVIISAWLIVTIALIYGAMIVGAVKDIPGLLVASILPNLVIYSYHRGDYEHFLLTMQLRESLLENKRLSMEEKANDLRAMIGNVAHDLKTVSTSSIVSPYFK
jgi:hypothetical protein